MRGAWQFKKYTEPQVESVALDLVRSFDLVAPMEQLDALRGILCKRLALPRCPHFPTTNLATDGDFNARTNLLASQKYKPQLRAQEQMRLMGDEIALRNLTLDVAWLDHRIYEWAVVDFARRLKAEGLAPLSSWSLGSPH